MQHRKTAITGTALSLCLVFLGLSACEPREADELPAGEPPAEAAEAGTDTMMDATAEGEAGWELLFNGETLAGWRGYRQESVPSAWEVRDGALHFTGEGEGGDIITQETYDNFELMLEWKIAECGNSGIFYRVQESDQYGNTYHTGPEYQVLDNTCHPDAQNGPDRTAGANYALHAPARDVTKPAGEWNQTRILVNGPHVEHWLNGEKVVEYELWSEDWQGRVQQSKFTEWPDYGLAQQGHIALQDHGDEVWFRNIRIRRL